MTETKTRFRFAALRPRLWSLGRRGLLAAALLVLVPACGGIYFPDRISDFDQDGDGLTDDEERRYGTNPYDADTDGDGLYDDEELLDMATDPLRFDTDWDGLGDGDEVFVYFTDPLYADSDGDGVSDGREVRRGTDPLFFD